MSVFPQISAEEEKKAEIKGMNYRAIAVISESIITKANGQVQVISRQAEA